MCTVTYIRSGAKTILTSNRDEAVARPALRPANYLINKQKVIFPKDPVSGGTWFAIDENANVAVLLNGAAEKHQPAGNYKKSRGIITLELITAVNVLQMWEDIDLGHVEPFTVVLLLDKELYQLRWDGRNKQMVLLDATKHYIWSSATLYPEEIRAVRSQWFRQFLEDTPSLEASDIFNFHRHTESGNLENGLVMNRNGKLKTLSITQAVIENNKTTLSHHDLVTEQQSTNSFIIL